MLLENNFSFTSIKSVYLKKVVKGLILYFKGNYTDWRVHLKYYIKYNLSKMSDNFKYYGIEYLLNIKVLRGHSSSAVEDIGKCPMHDMYCVYWSGKCEYEELSGVCTSRLRKKIKEKYN